MAQGCVLGGATATPLAVPDASLTQVMAGRYLDQQGVTHGFVAMPRGDRLLGDLPPHDAGCPQGSWFEEGAGCLRPHTRVSPH
jgi:hypothetical protein